MQENPESALIYDRLDSGEAEVLALAKTGTEVLALDARLVIIDEQKARRKHRKLDYRLRA